MIGTEFEAAATARSLRGWTPSRGGAMTRRRATIKAVIGGMAAFALALGGATAAVAAEPTGAITGTVVTSADGAPIPLISVHASNEDFTESGFAVTDENGEYRMEGLPGGEYTVRFETDGTDFVSEYWNDAADRESAQRVALTEGEGVDGIDAALDLGGSISGRVMRQSDGEPLESVTVRASTPDGSSTASVATDSDGAYRIPGLRGGDYIVSFTPDDATFSNEYWDDAYDVSMAAPVTVASGEESAAIDAFLAEAGTISGKVILAVDGSPVPGWVQAHDPRTSTTVQADIAPDGSYALTVPPGKYEVVFTPSSGRGIAEYWEDALRVEDATAVDVAQGQIVAGIDGVLDSYGVISGVVETAGTPSGDALVEAFQGGKPAGMAYTRPDGSYEISLPAGSYTLRARAQVYDPIYAPQYFDGVALASQATPITLATSADRAGVDFDLALGGNIAGTISTADGSAFSDARVTVLLQRAGTWHEVASVDSSGAFTFREGPDGSAPGGSLPAGTYTVRVEAAGYCTQYYGGVSALGDAETFTLRAGESAGGIDLDIAVECAEPQPKPTLSLSTGSIRAGKDITVSGTGFAPGATIAFELRSAPIALGTLTADADGVLRGSLRIPASAPAGTHSLVALSGGAVIASATLVVTAAAEASGGAAVTPGPRLAATGAETPTAIIALGVMLAVLGGLLVRRRRVES